MNAEHGNNAADTYANVVLIIWKMSVHFPLFLLFFFSTLILGLEGRRIVHNLKRNDAPPPPDSSESDEDSSDYWEDYNPNDRGIGFKKPNATKPRGYAFDVTPQPGWTQDPRMFDDIDDMDDSDRDYFAHYDFEFAKSGSIHANFNQKYKQHQAKAIERAKERKAKGEPIIEQRSSTVILDDEPHDNPFKPKGGTVGPASESEDRNQRTIQRSVLRGLGL